MSSPLPPKRRHRVRYEGLNHARHLNFSCYINRPFLSSDRAKTWMVEAIERSRARHGFALFAWAVMPTHVHILIFPKPKGSTVDAILKTMKQSVTRRALHWVKKNSPAFLPRMTHTDPDGTTEFRFWQRGGGYDRNLNRAFSVWKAINYIHNNPVEAGLCEKPADYPWSSARTFQDRDAGPLRIDFEKIPARPR